MRLRPYTTVLPKPLMPLGEQPLIEILIRQLHAAGIGRVILSVNYLPHLFRAVLDHTDLAEVEIEYFYEPAPLGTCGSLSLMHNLLPARFLVVNGDLLSDYPIQHLVRDHLLSNAEVTIATQTRVEALAFGVVESDADGRVTGYREKPETTLELSIGCYALERSAVEQYMTPGEERDMPGLIETLIAGGQVVNACAVSCQWIDIGEPDAFTAAQALYETLDLPTH